MSNRYAEIYDDVCVTLMRYATQKADEWGMTYFDWDAISEAHEMPDTNLIGPAGFGLTDEGKTFDLLFSIGISTVNDKNLFELRKRSSQVFKDFRPETVVDIYRHETGQPVSWMKITPPTVITPITRAASRPVQFITVQAVVDPGIVLKS